VTGSSVAGILTAIGSGFTGLSLTITAVAGLRPLLKKAKQVEIKVDDVHRIVNQQRTDMMNYQAALMEAMKQAGVDIPVDQSAPRASKKTT